MILRDLMYLLIGLAEAMQLFLFLFIITKLTEIHKLVNSRLDVALNEVLLLKLQRAIDTPTDENINLAKKAQTEATIRQAEHYLRKNQ